MIWGNVSKIYTLSVILIGKQSRVSPQDKPDTISAVEVIFKRTVAPQVWDPDEAYTMLQQQP